MPNALSKKSFALAAEPTGIFGLARRRMHMEQTCRSPRARAISVRSIASASIRSVLPNFGTLFGKDEPV